MAVRQEFVPQFDESASIRLAPARLHRIGLWLAAAGWVGMTLMWATGSVRLFGHDQEGTPVLIAIAMFLTGWVVMVAAMMIPSTLPTLKTVDRTLEIEQAGPGARFMVGYFWAWAGFGAAAFLADRVLHRIVDSWPWLAARPSLIVGGVAMFAGGAEVLGRTPPPLMPLGGRGAGSFLLGRTHAVDRIRRCWPVMLFAMAVGMSNPLWMLSLTCVMTLELRPRAQRALRLIGLGLFAMGVAVIFEPSWARMVFGTALGA